MPKKASIILSESGMTVQGVVYPYDVTEEVVFRSLGLPDRIVEGSPPAPTGHRNNRIFFYDSYGIYVMQHHKTMLMMAIGVVFHPDPNNPLQRQTRCPFSGELQIMELRLNNRSTIQQLDRALGYKIQKRYGALCIGHVLGHDLSVETRLLENLEDELADIEIGLGKPLFKRHDEPAVESGE